MANGVWVIKEGTSGDGGIPHTLAGHFVRDYKPPGLNVVIPKGWRYMQACNRLKYPITALPNEKGQGLIPESKLRRNSEASKHPNRTHQERFRACSGDERNSRLKQRPQNLSSHTALRQYRQSSKG